jgi:hypothetical protein
MISVHFYCSSCSTIQSLGVAPELWLISVGKVSRLMIWMYVDHKKYFLRVTPHPLTFYLPIVSRRAGRGVDEEKKEEGQIELQFC